MNCSMKSRTSTAFVLLFLVVAWCAATAPVQASDWTVITQGIQTDNSSGMTAQMDWEITAKANLTPATAALLPFMGIRMDLDAWTVQALDQSGPIELGGTDSVTCAAAGGLLNTLQALAAPLSVPPNANDPISLAVSSLRGEIYQWVNGAIQGGLFAQYDQAMEEMLNGCTTQLSQSLDITVLGPGTYRADAEATLSMVDMFNVSVDTNGGIGVSQITNSGDSGNLLLGATAHPERTLQEDTTVKLRCPNGTTWNAEDFECKAPETIEPDPPLWECPEDATPGSLEYCACPENVSSPECIVCGMSDGSPFPVGPNDPPIGGDVHTVCRTMNPFGQIDGQTCAIIELFCLGGPFPRPKTVPPGTTGEPMMGCSDGLSWGPCPDQPEGLPVLIPNQSPSYGLPDCWQVGDIIVNPVPGVCENTAPGLLADLTVSSIEVIGGPYEAGDTLLFAVKVRNQGSYVAFVTSLWLQIQGAGGTHSYEEFGGALAPGQERIFEISSSRFPYTAVAGPHLLNVMVDRVQLVVELTEENNSDFILFDVGSEPSPVSDLLVTPIELLPEQPTAGQALTAVFEIHNAGTVALPEATYSVRVDRGGEMEVESFTLPPTQPGDMLERSYTLPEVSEGPHIVSVFVDSEEVVTEDNENNNTTMRTFSVESADGECLPCTSGQPNNAVGAQYCTDPADPILPDWEGHLFTCLGVRANGTSCEPSGIHPNGWGYTGPRCPDPTTLYQGSYHPDLCGNPGVCPGTKPLPF